VGQPLEQARRASYLYCLVAFQPLFEYPGPLVRRVESVLISRENFTIGVRTFQQLKKKFLDPRAAEVRFTQFALDLGEGLPPSA